MTRPDVYDDDSDQEPESREPEVSKRSRGVALGLCFFGGVFGLHRFYLEKPKTAVAMLLTFGGLGVWYLYDLVLIGAGEMRDAEELPVRNWGVEASPFMRQVTTRAERRVSELEEQMDGLRQSVNELAERVDFAERMLAKSRSLESGVGSQQPRLPAPGS
jgi:TM2 domain-containing membrane protein YozV